MEQFSYYMPVTYKITFEDGSTFEFTGVVRGKDAGEHYIEAEIIPM